MLSTFFSFQYLELFGHIDPVRDATGIDSIMVGYNRVLFDVEPLVCRGFLKAAEGFFIRTCFDPFEFFGLEVFVGVFITARVESNR